MAPHNSFLITGGAGFVGSNLAISFKKKYADATVSVMDNLKRRGSELNLPRLQKYGIDFYHGDIRCPEDFPHIDYEALVECSAEPSVLAGFGESPLYVINTNLVGTINCLEEARKKKADVVFISTSRVYPFEDINAIEIEEAETRLQWKKDQQIVGWSEKGINENFTLNGARSIYGTSKLSSEMILQEYKAMYGLRGVINRSGVIAGPWQFGKVDQGVFTLWMLAHYFKRNNLRYIGNGGQGKQVRDLVHVEDIFELIDLQLQNMAECNGQIYNIGGGREISLSLQETTALCREITGNTIDIQSERENRPADLGIYIGDSSKIARNLGWTPQNNPKKILEDIFSWINDNEKIIKKIL